VLTQVDKVGAGQQKTERIDMQQLGTEKPPQTSTDWHLRISALTGQSLEELKERMLAEALTGKNIDTQSLMVTSSRHRDALQKTGQFIENALKGLDANLPGDLLAIDLRGALHQLGLITGAITSEDVLDSIFSRFCIGK